MTQAMSRWERVRFVLWAVYAITLGAALLVYGVANLGARGLLLCGAAGLGTASIATGAMLAWVAITCRKHEREGQE